MNFDANYFLNSIIKIGKYIPTTIEISLIAMAIGLVISISIVLIKLTYVKVLNVIINIYLSAFRGTPVVVQLFVFFYGFPQIFKSMINMDARIAVIIVLSMNSSAYMYEVFRGSISSIDKGQMEGALSIGMTRMQGMRRIVLPQAMYISIPALGNIFIDLIKSSSLAFVLGVQDIMAIAKLRGASSSKIFENYLAVATIYWIIIFISSQIQKRLEKLNRKGY